MTQRISRATLQKHLEEALWREALARHAIDALRSSMEVPNDDRLRKEATDAELVYRMARRAHNR